MTGKITRKEKTLQKKKPCHCLNNDGAIEFLNKTMPNVDHASFKL